MGGEEQGHAPRPEVGLSVLLLVYGVHLRICVQVTYTCGTNGEGGGGGE